MAASEAKTKSNRAKLRKKLMRQMWAKVEADLGSVVRLGCKSEVESDNEEEKKNGKWGEGVEPIQYPNTTTENGVDEGGPGGWKEQEEMREEGRERNKSKKGDEERKRGREPNDGKGRTGRLGCVILQGRLRQSRLALRAFHTRLGPSLPEKEIPLSLAHLTIDPLRLEVQQITK